MIINLKMQNFRKHVDRTIAFTPGINAIRAPNENGKSTTLEAIAYAFFGAKALKESLDEVVTYDIPTSKLKVELDFAHAGVTYHIVRGKSGAELAWSGGTVTGQTEVSKFCENLFGASHDMAGKLMLARQKDLGGALTEGATAAGKMIEDLADLGLIEEIVSQIGEELPCGNTAAQLATVETLRAEAAPAEKIDLEPLQSATLQAEVAHKAASDAFAQLKFELDDLDVDQAKAILASETALRASIGTLAYELEQTDLRLNQEAVLAPREEDLAQARADVEAEKSYARAEQLHAKLQKTDTAMQWDTTLIKLHFEVSKVQTSHDVAAATVKELRTALAKLEKGELAAFAEHRLAVSKVEGRIIRETTCALCQKDLTDVPEVVTTNAALARELAELAAAGVARRDQYALDEEELAEEIFEAEKTLNAASAYLQDLQAVVRHNEAVQLVYASAAEFITLDESVVPAQWTWTGPEICDGRPAVKVRLAELEQLDRAALKDAAEREAALKQRSAVLVKRDAAVLSLGDLPIADAKETLELAEALKPRVIAAGEAMQAAADVWQEARSELTMASRLAEMAEKAQAKAQANLAAAEQLLADMEANNALIKKLRAAKPTITDQLWSAVLAAVSTYFSDIRGERSIVTRAGGRFAMNGRPVSGLSGSAEDGLGLSIRIGMTKTFLPNVRFLILDEVAAACDDQRELAMLGLLATAGFDQVILVTHSALCESFAENIITI